MNQQRARFFDTKTGNELDQSEAFGRNGMLRDHVSMRVPMIMRDAADDKPLVTDAYGNSGLALRKPGFRIAVDNTRRQVVDAAYRSYQTGLVNAHRVGDGCDGSDRELSNAWRSR